MRDPKTRPYRITRLEPDASLNYDPYPGKRFVDEAGTREYIEFLVREREQEGFRLFTFRNEDVPDANTESKKVSNGE